MKTHIAFLTTLAGIAAAPVCADNVEGNHLFAGGHNCVSGRRRSLLADFHYGGIVQAVTLTHLTAGRTCVLTFYNCSFNAASRTGGWTASSPARREACATIEAPRVPAG